MSYTYLDTFKEQVRLEKERQIEKWGVQNHTDDRWGHIMHEEAGEVSEAIIEGDGLAMMDELVQVVAVIESWIEAIERR